MIYTIENDYYKAEVNSTGAELHSLYVKKQGFNCLWNGEPSVWPKRAPFLFPIVGKIRDDRYTLDGKEYTLTSHGFAPKSEFTLLENTKDSLRLSLKSSDATRAMYPFDFSIISYFGFSQKSLVVTRTFENLSPRVMPFSMGEHFGFICPFFQGEKKEEYSFTFEKEETAPRYPLTAKHLLDKPEPFLNNTRKIPITEELFKRGAVIFMGLKSKKLTYGKEGGKALLNFDFSDFSTIAFWSKYGTGIPYICIEPWNGYDSPDDAGDDLYEKPGQIMLEPGKSRSISCSIEVV